MITLKDIKVSKNRIPVQNAIWIRPMGGFKFKIYYPHGGDWEEMMVEAGKDPDDSLVKRVNDLEKGLKKTDEEVAKIKDNMEDLDVKVSRNLSSMQVDIRNMNDKVYSLGKTMDAVITTIESQVTSVVLPVQFTIKSYYNRWIPRNEMAVLGFNDLIFRSIYDGYCETAVVSGENYAITYQYEPIQDVFPGYGGPITLTGPSVTDPDTGEKYRIIYDIAVDIWATSEDPEDKWMYKITTRRVPGGEAYLIGVLASDNTKKAYVTEADILNLQYEVTRVYADELFTTPAENGYYIGQTVVVEEEEIQVPNFDSANGIYYEHLEPAGEAVFIGTLTSDSSKEAYVTIGEGDSIFDLRNGNKAATDEEDNPAVDGSYTGAGEVYTDWGGNCIINSFDVIGGLVKNIDMSELQ